MTCDQSQAKEKHVTFAKRGIKTRSSSTRRGKHALFQKVPVGVSSWKPVVLWWTARLPFKFLRQTFCFRFFSRTTVPLELRRQWTFWPNYTDVNPASTTICVDGEIGTVLKTYREVKTCTLQNDFSRKLILTSKGPYFFNLWAYRT